MTIFSDNPYDRRMEQLMMTVPNFAPRGVCFRFTEAQIFITATAATPTEILTATMRQIRCPPFRKRFNEYIESEEKLMTYINEKHRTRFTLAVKNVHRENYALLSALYLLTADPRLWSCCKHHINKENKGCTKYVTLPDDYRLSIDRDCIYFKKIYSLRTEIERYNSRFKQTGQERLWIHGMNSARNLNTIAHISLFAAAYAAIVTNSSCSYRSLKSVKRIA